VLEAGAQDMSMNSNSARSGASRGLRVPAGGAWKVAR